jgi:hypothetical protein
MEHEKKETPLVYKIRFLARLAARDGTWGWTSRDLASLKSKFVQKAENCNVF